MDIDEEDQDQDEDGWPAWDPAIFAADQPQQHGQNAEQAPPPQHFIDLDMSGSSMHFLRATGPDINISEVFQGLSSGDSSSSTSSDASSGINEEVAHFNATQSLCATALIFHRKGIPSTGHPDQTFQQGAAIRIRPILIDSPMLT